jgi:hypothetical protein
VYLHHRFLIPKAFGDLGSARVIVDSGRQQDVLEAKLRPQAAVLALQRFPFSTTRLAPDPGAMNLSTREADGLEWRKKPLALPIYTVPPRPPQPNGEAPRRGSSKARSSRATSWKSTVGRAGGSACGIQPSDPGNNALDD